MELITPEIRQQLLANHGKDDGMPVVKLFTPDAGGTWLLFSMDPDAPDILWGLCDLGLGYPELGSVSLNELKSVKGRLGLPIERDLHWRPQYSIQRYASLAVKLGYIDD